MEIFSLVKELESQGQQVTSLCVGEPDFAPPQAILQAAAKALFDGDTKYTAVTGTVPLRRAISNDLKTRKGLDYNPTTEIVVANGAKQAVYQRYFGNCRCGRCGLNSSSLLALLSRNGTLGGGGTHDCPNPRGGWLFS